MAANFVFQRIIFLKAQYLREKYNYPKGCVFLP